jgi:hypothetical protein
MANYGALALTSKFHEIPLRNLCETYDLRNQYTTDVA